MSLFLCQFTVLLDKSMLVDSYLFLRLEIFCSTLFQAFKIADERSDIILMSFPSYMCCHLFLIDFSFALNFTYFIS